MICQAYFDQWLTTIVRHLPPLSKPQALGLALWSFGMVLARSCALIAVSSLLAAGMQRKEQTVRQPLREWDDDSKRKRGTKRQELHVETCFTSLRGWVRRLVALLRQDPLPKGRFVPEPWPVVPPLEEEACKPAMAMPQAACRAGGKQLRHLGKKLMHDQHVMKKPPPQRTSGLRLLSAHSPRVI